MLRDEEFVLWCKRLSLSREAQSAIATIRSAGPARRVGGGRQNVSGRYPSRKMGVTIQFESHRVELAFVYEMEHDPDVLEYYDQAPAIPLEYESGNGRHLAVMHTPDCDSQGLCGLARVQARAGAEKAGREKSQSVQP